MADSGLAFPILTFSGALVVLFTLGIYHALPHRLQNLWLLGVSYLLCLAWAWPAAVILLALTAANFLLARRLAPQAPHRRRWLLAGISLQVLALIGFRTADFFVPRALALLGRLVIHPQPATLKFLIPIGLAYFTLQSIAYLVEAYQGKLPAHPFTHVALYLVYFPKLLAGPIERPRPFLEKLSRPRVADHDLISRSLALILIGLVRKLLIADPLFAALPAHLWTLPSAFTGLEILAWLVIFGLALYNDFAGYTGLVRGISGLFGLELSANFNAPFFARTFSEFWNRWHITLSHWLRDYVYFPLSRALARRAPHPAHWAPLVIPPLVTMAVSGLWHGLSWNMLLWGILHGLYQVIERLWLRRFPAGAPAEWSRPRQLTAMLIVLALVTLAWVPFNVGVRPALALWGGLLNWSSVSIQHRRLLVAFVLAALSLAIDWFQQRRQDEAFIRHWPRLARAGVAAATLLLVWFATAGEPPLPFVYQGF